MVTLMLLPAFTSPYVNVPGIVSKSLQFLDKLFLRYSNKQMWISFSELHKLINQYLLSVVLLILFNLEEV